jgi:flavorubredoxin
MNNRMLAEGVFFVGAIDWDRRLFDSLIPLPDGTSYNSYLIKGSEKTALIDTVDPTMTDVLIGHLNRLEIRKIDYVIANHAEQDHSGSLPNVLGKYPEAKLVCSPRCKEFLIELLMIPENKFQTVNDKDTISLGNRTLEFIHAPWVHWPETMFTYLRADRILFTCDFLGSHLATSDLFVTDEAKVYESAKRYYAEIMMPFRVIIKKHLGVIYNLEVEIIAPSHGPVHQKPEFILNAYKEWVSDNVKNEVLIPYISMHGSTRKMVDHLINALTERGITVKPFNLTKTDIGELAISLVDAATIIVASSTILVGLHPNVVYAIFLVNALRPKFRHASLIGSYGWGGKMLEQIQGMMTNLRITFLEPVIVKGYPREEDLKAVDRLADDILKKHKELGIL